MEDKNNTLAESKKKIVIFDKPLITTKVSHSNNLIEPTLLTIASTSGFAGMSLIDIDLLSGIILKWVSIVSFALLILISCYKLKGYIFGDSPKSEE